MKAFLPLLVAASTSLMAAPNTRCAPKPPAVCNYTPQCGCVYCLGPAKPIANAPVCPKTCNGDFIVDVSVLYWIAREDGLEYAIRDNITVADPVTTSAETLGLNQLVYADFLTPRFRWDWGFEAGVGYCSPCDGWDFELIWTWYKGKAHDHQQTDMDSNAALINLWSAYSSPLGGITFSRDMETNWNLKLNLVDLELGRHYWTSRYLSIRPFVGIRYASVRQDYHIQSASGVFSAITYSTGDPVVTVAAQIDHVDLKNHFTGAGVRSGLDSYWNVGCGWAIYGNFAASILYGHFNTEVKEDLIQATTTTTAIIAAAGTKIKIVDRLFDHFRSSRGILDLALGVQWASLFCDCQYGFTASLGWEHHLFFHQNQLWSINRNGDVALTTLPPNLSGENIYQQRDGNLSTGGLTLSVRFEF